MRDSDTDQDTMLRPDLRVENRTSRRAAEKPANRADQVRARHSSRQQPATRPIINQIGARSSNQKPRAARYVVSAAKPRDYPPPNRPDAQIVKKSYSPKTYYA